MQFFERPASVFKVHISVLILMHNARLIFCVQHLCFSLKCVVAKKLVEIRSVDIIERFVQKYL
jgi:hypothetical protein